MALLRPFRALRPSEEKAKQVSCVPYDVVHEGEVRSYIKDHPDSFLRVTRAEGEFGEDEKPATDEVFARARQNLDKYIADNVYAVDDREALYIYRLGRDGHRQTGVVGCLSIDEYERGIIKKHENVRPDKVEDRTNHLLALEAQTGLIFLAFRNSDTIRHLFEKAVRQQPLYDFECVDRVQQTIWRVADTAPWVEAFRRLPAIYVADGHHRVESAKRARDILRDQNPQHTGKEEYNFVVAGVFPAEDLTILPYNRVVKDLKGYDCEDFLDRVRDNFIAVADTVDKVPHKSGIICMYLDGEWYKLRPKNVAAVANDPIKRLDVSILQDLLLQPILGIEDARTDNRIGFIGGARGTAELERMVDAGEAKVAFSLFPTTMDDLFTVSDMGEIMPPKSTWFEPKLKDGLLIHQI